MAVLISIFEALSVKERDGFAALCDAYGELNEAEREDVAVFVGALRVGIPPAARKKVIEAVKLIADRRKPQG